MGDILPLRTGREYNSAQPRMVRFEDSDDIFDAISSETTREIFLSLYESPQTASELADNVGTSIQNIQYHISKLEDVDLISEVDTWYSESGTEMTVYAPSNESLVLFAGNHPKQSFQHLMEQISAGASILLISGVILWLQLVYRGSPEELEEAANMTTTISHCVSDPGTVILSLLLGGIITILGMLLITVFRRYLTSS